MASTHTPFPVTVVTPEGTCFDGNARELQVSSVSGGLGILARRAPVVADLAMGTVTIEHEDGTRTTWASEEGFVQASASTATVIVEAAIPLEELTTARADEVIAAARTHVEAAREANDESELHTAERELAWGEHLRALSAR
jgi:F-type H+-transporting ATPase subunit epsilon